MTSVEQYDMPDDADDGATTFASLPFELQVQIALLLSEPADLSALSRTCRACNVKEVKARLRNRGRGVQYGPCKRILKELSDIHAGRWAGLESFVHRIGPVVPLGCKETDACVDLHHWHAIIHGPAGTPYEHGRFKVEFQFPPDYPLKPPRMLFLTKVFHANIRMITDEASPSFGKGALCRGFSYGHNWSPIMTNVYLCMGIVFDVLADPNMDPSARENYSYNWRDQSEYEAKAREWTWRHARLHVRLRLWGRMIARLLGSLRRVRLIRRASGSQDEIDSGIALG